MYIRLVSDWLVCSLRTNMCLLLTALHRVESTKPELRNLFAFALHGSDNSRSLAKPWTCTEVIEMRRGTDGRRAMCSWTKCTRSRGIQKCSRHCSGSFSYARRTYLNLGIVKEVQPILCSCDSTNPVHDPLLVHARSL